MAKNVCPKCGGDSLWRSHRKGIEKLFLNSVIGLPYRCRSCRHRFYVFRNPFQNFTVKMTASAVVLVMLIASLLSTEMFSTRNNSSLLPESSNGEARTQKGAQVSRGVTRNKDHREESGHADSRDTERDIPQTTVSKTGSEWALFQARKSQQSIKEKETEHSLIIRMDAVEVRESSSYNAKIKFSLKKGQSVLILDRSDDWYLVRLEDGRMGWVHQSQL